MKKLIIKYQEGGVAKHDTELEPSAPALLRPTFNNKQEFLEFWTPEKVAQHPTLQKSLAEEYESLPYSEEQLAIAQKALEYGLEQQRQEKINKKAKLEKRRNTDPRVINARQESAKRRQKHQRDVKRNEEAANRLNALVTAIMAASDPNYGLTPEQVKAKSKQQEIEMRKKLAEKEEFKRENLKALITTGDLCLNVAQILYPNPYLFAGGVMMNTYQLADSINRGDSGWEIAKNVGSLVFDAVGFAGTRDVLPDIKIKTKNGKLIIHSGKVADVSSKTYNGIDAGFDIVDLGKSAVKLSK